MALPIEVEFTSLSVLRALHGNPYLSLNLLISKIGYEMTNFGFEGA